MATKDKPYTDYRALVGVIRVHGRINGGRIPLATAECLAHELRVRARLSFRLAMIETNDRPLTPEEKQRDIENDAAFIKMCAEIGARGDVGGDVRGGTVYAIHFPKPDKRDEPTNSFGGAGSGWKILI